MDFIKKISIKKTLILSLSTAVILFILFKTVINLNQFVPTVRNAHFRYLWCALLVTLPFAPLSALRWYFILWSSGHRIAFRKTFMIIMASGPLSILPGRLGDLARSYPLRQQIPPTRSIATIIFEKVIDITVLLFFTALGFFIIHSYIYATIALIFGLSTFPGLFITKKFSSRLGLNFKILEKINHAFGILEQALRYKKILALGILSSALNWFLSIVQVYFLYMAFGALVSIPVILTYLPLTIFVGLLPISIAGIGTRDSAMIAFFNGYATSSQTVAMGLGYSLLSYGLFAILGIPFFINYFLKEK